MGLEDTTAPRAKAQARSVVKALAGDLLYAEFWAS